VLSNQRRVRRVTEDERKRMGGLIIFNLAPKRISEKVRGGDRGLTKRAVYYFLINLFTSDSEENSI
jgi:hypothetical protein